MHGDQIPMAEIEFHTAPQLLNVIPHPYPATEHIPDWLKQMPPDFEQGSTLKRCPPFLAAMTAGYIIPAPADARFIMSPQGVLSAVGTINFLSTHFPAQYKGSPFTESRVVKFENPWVIKTPPDYVCLITAPINRFEVPFMALTGIVETSAYYREVFLPMVCQMQPGETFQVRKGMPMVQVIPIRREEWISRTGTVDATRRAEQEAMFHADTHFYKERFWQKMQFS